jgi:succinyl-diaminopimelate desuccinylase
MQVAEDAAVVQALVWAAEQVLGRRPPFAGFPGGTDARELAIHAGIPTAPAFGPGMLDVCHGPDESVPVDDIVKAAKIYALAAHRFLAPSQRGT